MTTIRVIPPADYDHFMTIAGSAFPGMQVDSDQARTRFMESLERMADDRNRSLWGAYRGDELQGGMIHYQFRQNIRGQIMDSAGIGLLAVDLLHKKEKIARDLVRSFIQRCQHGSVPLALLYPFRQDFYRQMGFGYGTKMNHYRVRTRQLQFQRERQGLNYLDRSAGDALLTCAQNMARRTHGMILREIWEVERNLRSRKNQIVGYQPGDTLRGYLVFSFKEGSTFLDNALEVKELVYEDREALLALLNFVGLQADQAPWTEINTLEADFHFLMNDPRNNTNHIIPSVYHESNTQGVGLMYRLVDVEAFFERLGPAQFGAGRCTIELEVQDSFIGDNNGTLHVQFADQKARLIRAGEADVKLRIDVDTLSALIMGAVRFQSLYRYGLVEISDSEQVLLVDRLFATPQPPVCLTAF
ncbi:MAG: GNAT family N-acetyltransferase [Candidatus Promineifilaceae bacterium]|nr:GNAT family N-acetyltransferase [Candidatus Promineifilaceae bacterium]